MEKNESEFSVSYSTGCQISPEDWTTIRPTLKVTRSTTIGEIEDWYKKKNKVGIVDVQLVEMEVAKANT